MFLFFFFNDPATTEIYTLSLHDALPISRDRRRARHRFHVGDPITPDVDPGRGDRKSTRLNSSHTVISYAVFCLKKKTRKTRTSGPRNRTLRGGLLTSIIISDGAQVARRR